jgi:hypothetical protein
MTTKDAFTAEEWTQLETAPIYAGMGIITADPAITSIFKETAALAKAVVQNPVPLGAQELVGGIVADFQAKAQNKEKFEEPQFDTKDPAAIMKQIYDYIGGAAAIVDEKASADEAQGYKEWMLGVAKSVAEAGKEGGFLGIGAVRVSDQEQTVLDNYSKTLGLTG